jgi:thioredoxin 1
LILISSIAAEVNMATIELDEKNFVETVNNNDFVIIDFWAPWCGPCQSFAPLYEELSEEYPEVVFAKVNTEDQQQLAAQFQIRSIPTLMVFREQIILYQEAGALPKASLKQLVTQVSELDMDEVKKSLEQPENT